MYFSCPFLAIAGEVEVAGELFRASGQGWFDREWSSQYLNPDQLGWDWLVLHLRVPAAALDLRIESWPG
ncbi:lipocalin-like domain-containing protein [Microbulbifer pacificus]|uniref:lipocalin-like domain-containing protein n=1 Tax=Microbulbifer pacificus TaxID=407164 RepID=UPI0018F88575|nr:lipocalin-like domain-containing protein [Microbulbifer pacificus]